MPALKNPKWEKFAQAVANGSTGVQAYKDEISSDCTTKSAIERACQLLSDINIASRVEEIQAAVRDKLEKRLGWSQEKAIAYLVSILETPVGEVDENHRLAQEIGYDTQGQKKIKLPGKGDAMKQLAAMAGWNAPEKVEHSGTTEIIIRKL